MLYNGGMIARHSTILRNLCHMLVNYDSGHRQRHAAALVDKNRVVSYGFNSLKTRASVLRHNKGMHARTCTHAEVDALRKVSDPSGLTLYVASLGRGGEVKNSKPCEDCQRLIDRSGLKRIIYTNGDGTYTIESRTSKRESFK